MTGTNVLIVGAGPVGLTLAIDLAWRGIDVTVVETRAPARRRSRNATTSPPAPWKSFGGSASPQRYATPVCPRTIRTTSAIAPRSPARADADRNSLPPRPLYAEGRPRLQLADAGAAAPHQPDFSRADPVRACRSPAAYPHPQPHVGRGCRGGRRLPPPSACATSTTGGISRIGCRFLIGCDGARSVVRKAIGAELAGDAVVQRVQSTYIRAPN